jgi:hypothetical protein
MSKNRAKEELASQKTAEKQQLDASRLNIAMSKNRAKEELASQKTAEKQQLAASRLNITMARQREAAAAKFDKDAVTFKKDMSFLMMPLFNPGSVWATLFSGRQTFSAMSTEHGKAFRAEHMGGMSAEKATAILVGGATLLGFAVKGMTAAVGVLSKVLHDFVSGIRDSYDKARQLYAKALMSGLGLGFTTKRGVMASIIGVSEEDVLKFGDAMKYLNPKLEWATSNLAKTAPALAQVSYDFKILETDMEAMYATIGADLAPALEDLTHWFEVITQMATELYKQLPKDSTDSFAENTGQSLLNAVFGNAIGSAIGTLIGTQAKIVDATTKHDALKQPAAFMKQMGASHWEKMGLVVGRGGDSTNDLIRKSNMHLKKIADAVTKSVTHRGDFGMSPATANP